MQANASLLSFLTVLEGETEHVFFLYLKELMELAPPKGIHWYDQKGAKNTAGFLWEEKRVKQWLLIGQDNDMKNIFHELIDRQSYIAKKDNCPDARFSMHPLLPVLTEKDVMQVEGIPVYSRSRQPVLYRRTAFDPSVTFLLDERTNCQFISGYKKHEYIRPVTPAGLFEDDVLYNYLKEKISAAFVPRDIFCDFSRKKDSVSGGKKLRGIVQMDQLFRSAHTIEIRDNNGIATIGTTTIDTIKGTWEIPLPDDDAGIGQLLIKEDTTETVKYAQRYVILNNLNIQTSVASGFVDLFGREMMVSEKETELPVISSELWSIEAAPDANQAAIELSDKMHRVLRTLGKHVCISDPYFLSPLIEKDKKIKLASKSQQVFLNALLIMIVQSGVRTLVIQGFHNNTGKHDGIKVEELSKQYKLLWQLIQQTHKNSPGFKLEKLELVKTGKKFHDRHWLSNDPANEIVYEISNSVNGSFENGQWSVKKLDDIHAVKVRSLIQTAYSQGLKTNLML